MITPVFAWLGGENSPPVRTGLRGHPPGLTQGIAVKTLQSLIKFEFL